MYTPVFSWPAQIFSYLIQTQPRLSNSQTFPHKPHLLYRKNESSQQRNCQRFVQSNTVVGGSFCPCKCFIPEHRQKAVCPIAPAITAAATTFRGCLSASCWEEETRQQPRLHDPAIWAPCGWGYGRARSRRIPELRGIYWKILARVQQDILVPEGQHDILHPQWTNVKPGVNIRPHLIERGPYGDNHPLRQVSPRHQGDAHRLLITSPHRSLF